MINPGPERVAPGGKPENNTPAGAPRSSELGLRRCRDRYRDLNRQSSRSRAVNENEQEQYSRNWTTLAASWLMSKRRPEANWRSGCARPSAEWSVLGCNTGGTEPRP
ncbi:hypothetical protein ZHAS_00007411 [Anopheles sinensis]|uniref:Uncharacterized protein n=1 Tax=Anopheles sinensis TaxID=74873 RepID=A0A084VP26_ANOSI|nr:hypothetical protein ZHAS_00007411 [Anopheles sinensis]